MAETTVSNPASVVQFDPIKIDWLNTQTPVVSSRDVAKHFGKKHKHVLRDIEQLRSNLPGSFTEPNFGPSEYRDETGRSLPAYNLTRDAFSLLVMGFTGPRALIWKLRYIEAFNALERAVTENALEMAREAGYRQGVDEARPALAGEAFENGVSSVLNLTAGQLAIVKEAKRYADMGLRNTEIAALLGCSRELVGRALRAVRP